jgi:hypothetical protein
MRSAVVLALAVASGVLVAPAAAEAIPPPCSEQRTLKSHPGSVRATAYWYCAGQEPLPLPVSIQTFFINGWYTVATGDGEAAYLCQGSLTRTFRLDTTPARTITANCL